MAKVSVFKQEEFNKAYKYCLSLTRNEEDAWDLLQTAYEKFLKRNGEQFEKAKAYLYQIIRNQFIDNYRKYSRWNFSSPEEIDRITSIDPNVLDDILISSEEIEYLSSLVSPEEWELLYLWAVEQYTVQEIADQTQTSKGTLLSKLHRLKKKIRNKLEGSKRRVGQ